MFYSFVGYYSRIFTSSCLDIEAALGITGIATIGLMRTCIRKSSSFFLLCLFFVETTYICVSCRSQHMESVLAPTLKKWG